MNRVGQQLLWVGLANGIWLLASAGCSSSDAPAGNTAATGAGAAAGSSNSSAGNTSFPGGGAAGAATGGGPGATAGSGNAGASGAATGTAGTVGTAGTAGAPAACSTDPNLTKATDCWVGCDPASATDNPQGLQGAFYTFGDGSSCTTSTTSVCSATGICLSGATVVDPTYAKWGCGIGMELNATGGTASMKQAYTGPATCFKYTLTGSSGGNEVRIAFTQAANTDGVVSPYVSVPAFSNGATGTVRVGDVSCQGQTKCTKGTTPYDLQINVVGGNTAGAYNLCLSDLQPVTSGSSTLPQLCGAQGSAAGTADVGKYYVQNNIFPNSSNNALCVTPTKNGDAVGFKVDSATFATGASLNAYPSIVDGWHFGRSSTDSALPKQLSALMSANSSVTYTGSAGKSDAAYDIWVLPSAPTATTTTPAGGLEVMMWLNSSGVNPAGTNTNTNYMGWQVWTGTDETWKYVAYVKNGQTTFSGDLAPFIKDAASRTSMPTSSYLAGIEFGFELYDYPGTGVAVTSYTLDVK
ncbi:MAG: hypothetical protein ABW061_11330 [Polyangiaceae bacterium]